MNAVHQQLYRVTKLGEHVFLVSGRSLGCTRPGCTYTYQPPKGREAAMFVGDACPAIGCDGRLEQREHQVDIAAYTANGRCTCEKFDLNPEFRKFVEGTPVKDRPANRRRCQHIRAARNYELDERLLAESTAQDLDGGGGL